jgi:exonuclease VII small subunit
MAKKTRNEFAVGITFSIVLVLTIYLVVMLADWSSLFTAKQQITVRAPYKAGLKGLTKGSTVNLGGVKVGTITKTAIEKTNLNSTDSNDVYVFFTMKILQQYRLRTDCVLLPQSSVLGGQVVLSIEDLGQQGNIINNGQTVDLLLADSVMDAFKREFNPDDTESFFAQMIKDVSEITEKIQEATVKVNSALETAQAAMKNIKELIEDERIDSIISNISEVGVNLKLTTREVRRAPWKLLYKPKQKEYKIQALIDSAGAFAAGAERLDNTAMRLNKLVIVSDGKSQLDIEKIESMVSELEASFEQFQKAEKKFWEELK